MTIGSSTGQRQAAIRVLPPDLANKIAAGEVVDRPASIVKELVENSIDAGAKFIRVSVESAGRVEIQVMDDGCGMARDDAQTAFERHATSKITDAADLDAITTLGFRGEALPSIASVAKLVLRSARSTDSAGVEIAIDGGKLVSIKDAPPVPGTTITVRDLFYNTPARLKFLKTDATEYEHIQSRLISLAMSNHDIRFELMADGRQVVSTLPGESRLDRIGSLFGRDLMDELIPAGAEAASMKLEGYISRPTFTRSTRLDQYFYVNGRMVRDKLLTSAIAAAYRSVIPKDRYPAVFLYITMPPEEVDVNVHPSKLEVRFRDSKMIGDFVTESARNAILGYRYVDLPRRVAELPKTTASVPIDPHAGIKPESIEPPISGSAQKRAIYTQLEPDDSTRKPASHEPPVRIPEFAEKPDEHSASDEIVCHQPAQTPETGSENTVPAEKLSFSGIHEAQLEIDRAEGFIRVGARFRVIGQVFKTFVLIESAGKLYLLDQHTAHERVLYEKFANMVRTGSIDRQELLIPLNLSVSKRDAGLIDRYAESFDRVGFGVERFGETGDYVIRSVPSLLAGKNYRQTVMDILDRLAESGKTPTFDEVVDDIVTVMACRGAVKADDILDNREIDALITALEKVSLPYSCPHGRPVTLVLDKDNLLKQFQRK